MPTQDLLERLRPWTYCWRWDDFFTSAALATAYPDDGRSGPFGPLFADEIDAHEAELAKLRELMVRHLPQCIDLFPWPSAGWVTTAAQREKWADQARDLLGRVADRLTPRAQAAAASACLTVRELAKHWRTRVE